MPKTRADDRRNRARITAATIRAPLATQEEIAKMAWVSQKTANKTIQKLQKKELKDDRIVGLVQQDLDIVVMAQKIIVDKFNNPEEVKWMRVTEVSNVARESAARYTLFGWAMTDEMGTLKEMNLAGKSLAELEQIRKDLLLDR